LAALGPGASGRNVAPRERIAMCCLLRGFFPMSIATLRRPSLCALGIDESGSGGNMAVGKVKWFNDEKGWGFIKQESGPDVFVHYSQISGEGRRRLFEDELVKFEIKEGPKGLQAVNVVRTDNEATV
jgi:CspA family cold shock protein